MNTNVNILADIDARLNDETKEDRAMWVVVSVGLIAMGAMLVATFPLLML